MEQYASMKINATTWREDNKGVNIVHFLLHKVKEQAKLTDSDKSQNTG